MSDVLSRYREIADGFSARVEAASDDQWESASPCEGWTARDVVSHVVNAHRQMMLGQPEFPRDGDLRTAWRDARQGVETLAADPDRVAETVETPMGPMTRGQLIGSMVCMDVLVHTWDLSRALGADERLHQPAVTDAYDLLKPMDAMIRRPGAFGPKIEPPSGADLQTEFLCFLGRPA